MEKGIHYRVQVASFSIHLIEKKLYCTNLLAEVNQHIVPSLITSVTHRNTIWVSSLLDILSTRAKGDDMLNRNTIMSSKRRVLHSDKAGWACFSYTVGSDFLKPITRAGVSLFSSLWNTVGLVVFRLRHSQEVVGVHQSSHYFRVVVHHQ